MTNPEFVFRGATKADLDVLYGDEPKPSVRAWVATMDGKPVGAVGVAWNSGVLYAFSTATDEYRKHKKAMVRGAHYAMKKIRDLGLPVMAIACPDEMTSGALLEHFGFKSVSPGGVYMLEPGEAREKTHAA